MSRFVLLSFCALVLAGIVSICPTQNQLLAQNQDDPKTTEQDSSDEKDESKAADTKQADDEDAKKEDSPPKEPNADESASSESTKSKSSDWFSSTEWLKNNDDPDDFRKWFDPIDKKFGDFVVTPISDVFFFDIYTPDNGQANAFKAINDFGTAKKDLAEAISTAQNAIKELDAPPAPPEPKTADSTDDSKSENDKKESDTETTGGDDDNESADVKSESTDSKSSDSGSDGDDADETLSNEEKAAALKTIRNDLKSAIDKSFTTLIASKIPSDDLKNAVTGIKQAFVDLDGKGDLTESNLVSTINATKPFVSRLEQLPPMTKSDVAWANAIKYSFLNQAALSVDDRTAYLKGEKKDLIEQKIEKAAESAFLSINDLEDQEYLESSGDGFVVATTTDDEGNEVAKSYTSLGLPLIVVWLVLGATFFTLRMAFINIRAFFHAIAVTFGLYDNPNDPGEISHFQALSSALSATVGLGNIAGVAIAVSLGGPGAIVWMIIAGFLGMTSKFTECTLGQMYRNVDEDGEVLGGPMRYLSAGLKDMRLGLVGKLLALIFVVLCIGGSFGGGNMFQANQSYAQVSSAVSKYYAEYQGVEVTPEEALPDWAYGLGLAFLVGLVIIGGIKRIGSAAGMIVPLMCLIYLSAGAFVIYTNVDKVPEAFQSMLAGAFSFEAGLGGFLGTLVVGFQRAAFSNEAGTGSASIAHSAAATDEPVREGIVALLEPFIDTIVVCTMTGLVVVITGEYQKGSDGVLMTSNAFETVIDWFPYVLSGAVFLFAFSTMISWSYYGERCAIWLFGKGASLPYKLVFLVFIFFGSVFKLGNVLGFSDLMILGMAFPNILGLLLLSGKVRRSLDDYMDRLDAGHFDRK